MPFILQINTSNQLTLYPKYNLKNDSVKIENRHRSRSGREFVYKWSEYRKIKLDVEFVDSSFRAIANSWWSSNTDLQFYEYGGTQVFSVRMTGKSQPIDSYMEPYDTLFKGSIELESF